MSVLFRLQPVILLVSFGLVWLFPVCALGARFGLWNFKVAFSLLAGCALTGAIILALAGVGLIGSIRQGNEKAKHRSMLVIFVLIIPMGVLFSSAYSASQVPRIHDISTDLESPPEFSLLLDKRPKDANTLAIKPEVIEQQKQYYTDLSSLELSLDKGKALQLAKQAAEQMGWHPIMVGSASDGKSATLEAVDTTFWFGFKDDIVVRIAERKPEGVTMDVRSVSRVGQSDLGKNAKRIRQFLDQVKTASTAGS